MTESVYMVNGEAVRVPARAEDAIDRRVHVVSHLARLSAECRRRWGEGLLQLDAKTGEYRWRAA